MLDNRHSILDTMADLGFELEEIARLIKLVEQRGLAELIVEDADRRIVIRGVGYGRQQRAAAPAPAQTPGTTADATTDATTGAGAEFATPDLDELFPEEKGVAVLSPMVGVFYRSAGPDTAPYVEVGDHVEVGQTIGMIEAMKVFSEVPSDHAGTVSGIAAENGQLVKSNEPILYLIPD
jgi:acetyl-CoA carboxylase biotin carboxyl carrier protein